MMAGELSCVGVRCPVEGDGGLRVFEYASFANSVDASVYNIIDCIL